LNIIVLTPVRLFGDGLGACFGGRPDISVLEVVNDLAALRDAMAAHAADIVLVDVTQGIELFDLRALATQWPNVALVALGLHERKQDVIQCGRLGFTGYVARDASVAKLCAALSEIAAGRLSCPPEISSGLLRALFREDAPVAGPVTELALTRREMEVLDLLGEGLSNKEIGNQLCLSVATVKHHVHNVLDKLKLSRRAEAMRKVRDAPWLARPAQAAAKKSVQTG
jgi:DNA-binding NarL/FixJ family response regulator